MDNSRLEENKRLKNSNALKRNDLLITPLLNAIITNDLEVTDQRLRIIYALCALEHIENAEELWLLLKSKKRISRATVYSFLNFLVELGYVKKTIRLNGGSSFMLNILRT